jgi:hypothetical protein
MHQNPHREGLSTRKLLMFFFVGLTMVILGVADFDDSKGLVLMDAVVMAFNGKVLYQRWVDQAR